jgi:hypothetical protein
VAVLLATTSAAFAADEIQIYNAQIAAVGQWTIEQHLNYTIDGRKQPDFPGGLVPNHALNGTPEWAYGMTDWWEVGFYAPFAVSGGGAFLSNGAKIRNLFVSPYAAERNFFYGVNFEFSYQTPAFSQTRFALEIRPIVGVRNSDWELSLIRSSTSVSARSAKPIFCLQPGLPAISARTASSASNTIPISARSEISRRSSSSSTSYSG